MWDIYEHRRMVRVLTKLPMEVLKRYETWKDIVHISGPRGLSAIKGFHDEALKGDQKGQRSSRLGQQYRVIYEGGSDNIIVYVIDLTAHDYRRK